MQSQGNFGNTDSGALKVAQHSLQAEISKMKAELNQNETEVQKLKLQITEQETVIIDYQRQV